MPQLVLTIAAGVGLWYLWAKTTSADPRAAVIVTCGFILRAIIAQALFWISWLRLPIGESLQLGKGFWFFAVDGAWYLENAEKVLRNGPAAVFSIDAVYASHAFVQIVAVCVAAFGSVAAVAILLNCAAYLATCAVIVRIGGCDRQASRPCLVALLAVAFGPATMLWSLQLLKDTYLLFLTVAIFGACRYWQDFWLDAAPTRSSWRLTAVVAAMAACFYSLSGMRWYFALVIWTASAVFFAIVVWRAERRRAALAVTAAVFVLLSQSVRLGGDGDIPFHIRRVLDPRPSMLMGWRPSEVTGYLERARDGFENTPGGTTISAGPTLARSAAPPSEKTNDSTAASGSPTVAAAREVTPRDQPTEETTAVVGNNPDAPTASPADVVPQTWARVVAVLLPRAVGQAVGLVQVGGGRGLWLFAELDTIAFDVVLLFAAWYSVRTLRYSRAPVPPLFVLLVLILVLLFPPMVYTVNNFGTLLRLRQMLYIVAAIIPLTLVAKRGLRPSSEPR
jgi:hypothetical protein